jgi:hypothetical protein
MSELSPAAQAIMVAATNGNFNVVNDPVYKQCIAATNGNFNVVNDPVYKQCIAAALRAAADQVVPVTPKPNDTFCCPPVDLIVWRRVAEIRSQFLAIVAELEGVKYGTYRCDLEEK